MENYLTERLDRIEAKLDELLGATPVIEKEILTIEDIERDYGISPHRQREARKNPYNPLAYIMLGNGIRYRKEHVDAWLNKQSVTSE